jgi:hypothetical protein
LAQPIAIGAAVERTQFRAEFQRLFTAHCYGSQAGVHSVSMNVIPLILIVELGVFVFYLLRVSERYRAGAIRALAIHSGMHKSWERSTQVFETGRNAVLLRFKSLERR